MTFPIDYLPDPPQPERLDAKARALAIAAGLRIWRHLGQDGVNVYSQQLADELREAGCKVRVYQPEMLSKPDRLAWECVLPNPYPPTEAVEAADDRMATGT